MATHSSILAWRIPWAEELDRLQPMGLQRIGHNSATKQQNILCVYVNDNCTSGVKFMSVSLQNSLRCNS